MRDSFTYYHPLVNFYYFTAVIVFAMFFLHPFFLAISFFCAFFYSIILNRKRALKFNLIILLPVVLFSAIINPLFNHRGVTILFYFQNGNPVTLESIYYGIAAAVMFASVLLWFSCCNAVMTSDKFIYLFGKAIPATSLILSMVLRFVPKFKAQIKVIADAQKCIGRDITCGSLFSKAKNGLKILSIMTTWALENAIETADSMHSRGYGLKGRTSFSNYRFDRRDLITFFFMILLSAVILSGAFLGYNNIRFFPSIKFEKMNVFFAFDAVCYLLLCIIPLIVSGLEEIKWSSLKSKI